MYPYSYFLDIPDIHGSMSFRKNTTYGKYERGRIREEKCSLECRCNIVGLYMQNVTGGLNAPCLQHYGCRDEWRCFFAPVCIVRRRWYYFLLCFVHTVLIPLHQDPHVHWKLTV